MRQFRQPIREMQARRRWMGLVGSILALLAAGCAPGVSRIGDPTAGADPTPILRTEDNRRIDVDQLVADLADVQVAYVGERHTHPAHHKAQLAVLEGLHTINPDLTVAMEMFDVTYQPVLDRWSAGELTEAELLRRTHWYANWKYDFDLYREILLFIRKHRIRLVGINIPFHIPAKISVGGLDSLRPPDAAYLPETLDLDHPDHRAYVERIYRRHHPMLKGRDNFESFYAAQAVWEDAMAEAIAHHLDRGRILVLVGNGHIVRKFGIPDRAFSRTGAPFRTVLPVSPEDPPDPNDGDYLWYLPPHEPARSRMMSR
jgi:uncharacterized iron-regulated protein